MRAWWCMALVAISGCDDTLFETPTVEYSPDWLGVQVFMVNNCAECHPGLEPAIDLPVDISVSLCAGQTWLVSPGDPEGSMLWRIISGDVLQDDPPQMPPSVGALPDAEIAHIYEWIEDGAEVTGCE